MKNFVCPSCGRPLPEENIQAAREKALGRFNEDKAERLKAVIEKGAGLKEEKQRISGELDAIRTEKGILEEKIPRYEADLKQTTGDRDALKVNSEDFSRVEGRARHLDEIAYINLQIKEERDGKAQDTEKLQLEVGKLNTELLIAKTKVDAFVRREQGEKRVEELKSEEKSLSKEYERLESELYLLDLFLKQKVELLTDRINSKFEFTRFRLFSTLINGGIEPTCEILVNGVGYNSGLNSAARTQAGLDIIRTLQRHYGISPVVWIDNRESCTLIPKMDCQVVSLYVSPEDTQLRIEVEPQQQASRKQESLFNSRAAA